MKKFAIGVVAGASSLLLAAPLVVQVAGAASSSSTGAKVMREAPTQACMQAMLKAEDVRLAEFDSMVAKHKQAMQQRRDSLATVAAIADDTARKDALQKLHETMRTSMQTAQENMSDAMKSALEAAKTACGNSMMLNMGSGMGGPGMMKGGMHKNGRGMMRGNSDGMFGGWGK